MKHMQSSHIRRIAFVAGAVALLVGLALSSAPTASATNPGILPPQSSAYGQTYGEWAADWWTWVIEQGFWPLVDSTGEDCAVGQSGQVWFLAGSWVGPVERTCEVPAGKALFFPVQNYAWFSFPDDPYIGYPDYPEPGGEEVVRAGLAAYNDGTGGRYASIDGVEVEDLDDYRVTSPEFEALLPDGNAFGLPEMTLGPNYDDGWYLMLAPLSVGEHEIEFTGDDGDQDIKYNLEVVAGP